jgi:hypothetical protein
MTTPDNQALRPPLPPLSKEEIAFLIKAMWTALRAPKWTFKNRKDLEKLGEAIFADKELRDIDDALYDRIFPHLLVIATSLGDTLRTAEPLPAKSPPAPPPSVPLPDQPTATLPATQPQVAQPQVAQPQVAQPQVAQPQVAQPQVAQPQVAQPQVAQPPATPLPAPASPARLSSVTPIGHLSTTTTTQDPTRVTPDPEEKPEDPSPADQSEEA